jgi:predicted RNase H-like HicB family nuclease
MSKSYTYRIIIEPDGELFHGYVPALRGCHTTGSTIVEVQELIKDAIRVYLESLVEDGISIPSDNSFESFQTISLPLLEKASYA